MEYCIILFYISAILSTHIFNNSVNYGIFPGKKIHYISTSPINFTNGCCYSVGFGSLMIPHYNSYNTQTYNECRPIELNGGARRHYNVSCNELKQIHDLKLKNKNFI